MNRPRSLRLLSGLIAVIGTIALIDGYAEFASGEEGVFRWLLLPASQYLIAVTLFMNARKQDKLSEANNA